MTETLYAETIEKRDYRLNKNFVKHSYTEGHNQLRKKKQKKMELKMIKILLD